MKFMISDENLNSKITLQTRSPAGSYLNVMALNQNSRVGIDTDNPSNLLSLKRPTNAAQLRLEQSNTTDAWTLFADAAGGHFRINRVGAGAGEYLTILNGGNLGIGTASPAMSLDVQGSHVGGLGVARIKSTSSISGGHAYLFMDSYAGGEAGLRLANAGSLKWDIFTNTGTLTFSSALGPKASLSQEGALTAAGKVSTPELCIGADCKTSWSQTQTDTLDSVVSRGGLTHSTVTVGGLVAEGSLKADSVQGNGGTFIIDPGDTSGSALLGGSGGGSGNITVYSEDHPT